MKYMKLLTLSLMLLVSFGFAGIVHALSTTEPASQIVSYYNTDETDTYVQVTNTSLGSPVVIHLQILDENCTEVDRFITLTERDTHVFNIDTEIGAGTRGIVIINATAAVNDFNPIDFPHLVGTTILVDEGSTPDYAYNINTLGRQLVGGVWELHQPTSILSPINSSTLYDSNEFISMAWADVFAGGYIAVSGSAATKDPLIGVFIIDDAENRTSCGQFDVECISELGPTFQAPSHLDNDKLDPAYVCEKSVETLGLVQLLDIVSVDNYVALAGGNNDEYAGLHYATNTTPIAVGPPPTEDCDSGVDDDGDGAIDCADSDCAADAACAEGGAGPCNDGVDNDGANGTDCADAACDGVGFCEAGTELSCADGNDNDADGKTDCDDSDCDADAACDDGGDGGQGGGGGGGCSVATAATGLGSMANALVLLIPAFGIGARRIRQRLNK